MKCCICCSDCTLWELMVDSFLSKSSKTGLHCLAEDLLTGGGERRNLQGVQLWEKKKTWGLSCEGYFIITLCTTYKKLLIYTLYFHYYNLIKDTYLYLHCETPILHIEILYKQVKMVSNSQLKAYETCLHVLHKYEIWTMYLWLQQQSHSCCFTFLLLFFCGFFFPHVTQKLFILSLSI